MTGHFDGRDVVVARRFRAPIADVWASVTEPERTARWFGAWRGDGRTGASIEVQMGFEDGTPWLDTRVEACAPPTYLALVLSGGWRVELALTAVGEETELVLTHRGVAADEAPSLGPGWEYYLDMLVASRDGAPPPSFDDYYPGCPPATAVEPRTAVRAPTSSRSLRGAAAVIAPR